MTLHCSTLNCRHHFLSILPRAHDIRRPVATGRVSCVCDWLSDATGLDSGNRSWICNAAQIVQVLLYPKRSFSVNDSFGAWLGEFWGDLVKYVLSQSLYFVHIAS